MKSWLSLFALSAVACSSSGTWRRVETQHFVLNTDLGSGDAKHAAAALEATRDALVSAAWPNFKFAAVKAHAYVLANDLEFERYFGHKTGGLFLHSGQPMFFLPGAPSRWELRRTAHHPTHSILRHEMAHDLSREVWPVQPTWFSEGFADFLSAIYYSEDGRNVVLGGVNFSTWNSYRSVRTTTFADMLAWKGELETLSSMEGAGLYGYAWLFVHWLYQHPDEFLRFIDQLGQNGHPHDALKIAIPNLDAAAFDRELHEYQKHGAFTELTLPLVETPIDESKLRDDVLAPDEVNEVKRLLERTGREWQAPSHVKGETSERENAKTEPSARSKPPRKKIDYSALPKLEQYCEQEPTAADAANKNGPTTPAKVTKSAASAKPKKSVGATETPPVKTQGGLPPELIQKIVRDRYARFRGCYEAGLARNPDLGGAIQTQFTIELDGTVHDAKPGCGTTMPDAQTVTCVTDNFNRLKFPKPEGGVVTVVYPIVYSPRD